MFLTGERIVYVNSSGTAQGEFLVELMGLELLELCRPAGNGFRRMKVHATNVNRLLEIPALGDSRIRNPLGSGNVYLLPNGDTVVSARNRLGSVSWALNGNRVSGLTLWRHLVNTQ